MARPLRIEFPGALYHVTARGNARHAIFLDDRDREGFLDVLGHVVQQFRWRCYAYCLMPNHYHLVIETLSGRLAAGMRQLNGMITQRFNRRHQRVGHLLQGRYKAILVQRDPHLLEVVRYVVLNPVRARLVAHAEQWRWSSYRVTVGRAGTVPWVASDWVLAQFGTRRRQARQRYAAFVAEGRGKSTPWRAVRQQIFLGSEGFVRRMQAKMATDADLSEVPRVQRVAPALPLAGYAARGGDRATAMAAAYASGGYSLKQIGAHFGVHYSTVSRAVRRQG